MKNIRIKCLLAGGIINIVTATLHVMMIIVGVSVYQYFGAPAVLIEATAQHHLFMPIIVMTLLAAAFFISVGYMSV
jgi:hypothetical protein